MLLPNKYLTLSNSFIGLGGIFITILKKKPLGIDELWIEFTNSYIKTKIVPPKHSFDTCILTIEMLFSFGVIDFNEKEELVCIF